MPTSENLLLCLNFVQKTLNERNLAVTTEFIAENSIHHELGDVPEEFRGGPRAMAMFLDLYLRAFPDLKVTVEDAMADRDRVVTRWRLEGTQDGPLMGIAPSGRRVSIEGIRIDRLAGGKIVESWMQWDSLGLLEQIGALPKLRREPLRDLAAISSTQEPPTQEPCFSPRKSCI
jgi:predicted ester cyclase